MSTWSVSTIIAKLKSTFNIKVAQSPPTSDEDNEETEPLVYEFTQEKKETETIESGSSETSDNDTDITDENDAISTSKSNILGMFCVALGTGLFCSIGAVVQMSSSALVELMLGRLIIQNILSWFLWFVNPYQVKGTSINWYGDEPHRVNVWTRGFLWFCSLFFWWCALELLPIGLCHMSSMQCESSILHHM